MSEETDKQELWAELDALGVEYDKRWGIERLSNALAEAHSGEDDADEELEPVLTEELEEFLAVPDADNAALEGYDLDEIVERLNRQSLAIEEIYGRLEGLELRATTKRDLAPPAPDAVEIADGVTCVILKRGDGKISNGEGGFYARGDRIVVSRATGEGLEAKGFAEIEDE